MKLPVVLFQQMNTPTAVFTITTTLLWYMLGVPVFICRFIASVGFNEMNAALSWFLAQRLLSAYPRIC